MSLETWARGEAVRLSTMIIDRYIASSKAPRSLLDKVFTPAFRGMVSQVFEAKILEGWESPLGWSVPRPSPAPEADRMELLRRTFDLFLAEACAAKS